MIKKIFSLLLVFFFSLGFLMPKDYAYAVVHVGGYTKKNGTYVAPHYRSDPDSSTSNNWSTKGNVNPYTGKEGTKNPSAGSGVNYVSPATPIYASPVVVPSKPKQKLFYNPDKLPLIYSDATLFHPKNPKKITRTILNDNALKIDWSGASDDDGYIQGYYVYISDIDPGAPNFILPGYTLRKYTKDTYTIVKFDSLNPKDLYIIFNSEDNQNLISETSAYIKLSPPKKIETVVKNKIGNANLENVRLRLLPSLESTIIGKTTKGQEFEILEENDEWYRVNFGVLSPWIMKKYISLK